MGLHHLGVSTVPQRHREVNDPAKGQREISLLLRLARDVGD